MKIKILFIYLVFSCYYLNAGDVVGNGGDVVVCENGEVTLLDFYEASEEGIKIINSSNPEIFQAAKETIQVLRNIDEKRFLKYSSWIDQFESELEFTEKDLIQIYDSGKITQPKDGCLIKQIAIQRELNERNKRYIINQKLWEKLDHKNRVGLVIHEIIYREAITFGQINSINTRKFNNLINSNELLGITLGTYRDLTRRLGFQGFVNPNLLKPIFEFYLENIIDKTFFRKVENQSRNNGKAVANIERTSHYTDYYITGNKFYYTEISFIKSLRWDLDEKGRKIEPALVTNRRIENRYEAKYIKEQEEVLIYSYNLNDSSSESNRSPSYGKIWIKDGQITISSQTVGYSLYRKTNQEKVPGISDVTTNFYVTKNGIIIKTSKINVFEVNPSNLKIIKQIQKYDLTSKAL